VRWYTLPGWPASVQGHSAATPVMVRPFGSATQYKGEVTGHPGTVGVDAPTRNTVPSPDWGDKAQMGFARSSDAPDMIYPNQYWARPQGAYWPGAGMPVSVRSDNLMPVPATDPRGVPAPLQVPMSIRGNRQIRQPATLIQWPTVGS